MALDGVTTSYGYDSADLLASESRTGQAATYSCDGNGNRLANVVNGIAEESIRGAERIDLVNYVSNQVIKIAAKLDAKNCVS